MKANESPEKIYLHPDIGDKELIKPWLKRPFNENSIEYTCTDAFIKKACDWLEKELPVTDLSSSNMLKITFKVFDKENKKVFIENFKKYMKE